LKIEILKISKRYEQVEEIAEGYNFPAEFVEKKDDFVRKNKIEYVIGVYSGKSIAHEAKKLKEFFR
jgi:penicillin-binding protein-related factor A (putative recombinase)